MTGTLEKTNQMAVPFLQARALILERMTLLPEEPAGLAELCGRVLANDFYAPGDLPCWANSEMDGFAVRVADCRPGTRLRVVGELPAGSSAAGQRVTSGTAVRIMTGAPVPEGCDAVLPIEETEPVADGILVRKAVRSGEFIRDRGCDISAGELMIPAGTVLRPAEVNLLAVCGITQAAVRRRPRVAVLSTGDELVAPGEAPGPGRIIDGNSYSLAAAISEIGATPEFLGIARDNTASLREKIAHGLESEALVTSAGVSAGDHDLVRETLAGFGVEQVFWKVSMKPSGPTAFGLKEAVPVFSLPGNPVSSMVGFDQLVRPALLKMMGHSRLFRPLTGIRLLSPLSNETGKTRFLRLAVRTTPDGLVGEEAGNQNTGILSTMIRANAFAILPPECREIAVGETIDVEIFGPL